MARRYQALRRDGVLRVVGPINPAVQGEAQWVARIRCCPDRVGPLADALTRRSDIAYANLASGGTEIICMVRSPVDSERDDILRHLPRRRGFYRYLSTRLAALTSIESYAVSVRVRRLKQGALRVPHGRLVRRDHG